MANSVVGVILAISEPQTMQSKNGTQFTKRSIYLDNGRYDQTTGEKYENPLLLDFINKSADAIANFKKGDRVKVTFDLRGRTYQDKDGKTQYGISVNPYKIEPFVTQQAFAPVQPAPAPQPQPAPQSAPGFPPPVDGNGNPQTKESDNLPF